MIPEFDEHDNLPPEVYWAEWEEFKDRFGTTPLRSRMINGLQMAMEQLKAAGCRTIYINGSFVTSNSPNSCNNDECLVCLRSLLCTGASL
ncbi:hypothetical protein QUA30_23200 [Microcoleus sp. Pol14C2]|uniref:DUF6932 family protein n=1 Tax=unclassified Microcoleus TaxID=2642155 RepID=UPI002FD73048